MIKYTLEQLQKMTEAELNEACAITQGWVKQSDAVSFYFKQDSVGTKVLQNYTPTTNKSQAWDLLVKYELDLTQQVWGTPIEFMVSKNLPYDEMIIVEDKSLARAIVLASILAAQEVY